MFINQSQMNHLHDSASPARPLHSVPPAELNNSNYIQQSSLGRSILLKPIGFVSNHRRSASLSGLVKRHSPRKIKTSLLSSTNSLRTPAEHLNNTTTTTPNLNSQQQSHPHQLANPPQPILDPNFPAYPQTTRSLSHPIPQQPTVYTLPIIQPRSTWGPSYDVDRRCFKINLRHPRQQVTSLLALSSIPRPVTPPFDDERENTASVILTATRTAIEEEAIRAAIAASIQTENNRLISHWADQQKSPVTGQ